MEQLSLLAYGDTGWGDELLRGLLVTLALALTLVFSALGSEVVRSAYQAVSKGQSEAAAALGLKRHQMFFLVVLPQMWRHCIPAFGKKMVLLLKASSLVSIITVRDVMGQARFIYAQTFDLSVYYIAAANYLLVVLLIEAVWRRLERRNVWLKYTGK